MPVLKAKINGVWVPLGSGGSGNDEVDIGPTVPTDPGIELWYDTDDPQGQAGGVPSAGLLGQVLGKLGNEDYNVGWLPTSGAESVRPTAPSFPMRYWATDTQRDWQWNGSVWLLVGGRMPRVHLTRLSSYSLANGANTAIPWNNEVDDTDNFHDNATNPDRITIPRAGRYRVDACIGVDANATGTRAAWFEVGAFGGTRFCQAECPVNSATYGAALILTREFALVAGDWVRVVCYQASGGNLNMPNSTTSSHFAAQYMGPS